MVGLNGKGILFYLLIQSIQKTMNISKKKSDVAATLDQLRSEDPKKRMNAVSNIKEVATALGPARARSELIGFLAEFLDDEQHIILELLNQLDSFSTCLGGTEYEKLLLPLLISFCKTDQRKVALKSCSIIEKIAKGNKDLVTDIIRKLMKVEMNISKECGLQLMAAFFSLFEGQQTLLMEMFVPLFSSDSLQVRIIASKYLLPISRQAKSKEQITKILELLYSQGGELEKIYALETLVEFYDVNNNFALTKFKHLSVINSWRINIKVCELAGKISEKIQKSHFKLIFEPMFLKFMGSAEPELKAASCKTIGAVCKNMTDDEHKNKLQSSLKKLAAQQTQYVKIQMARNIVPICSIVSNDFMAECLLPNILNFMKDPNSEVALAVAENFEFLASKMNKDALEDKIIKPLLQQLTTNNWRIKCQIIKILKSFLLDQTYLSQDVLKVFVSLTDDRIDAVRLNANQLIVEILTRNSKDWCDQNVIPKVFASRDNISYIKKQNLLDIIEKTSNCVSDKALKETYQTTCISYIADKVPNVRLKCMQVIKTNAKLTCPTIDKHLEKMKDDKDNEIREYAKRLRA